jgi:EmrB/QacA subfamily drug resistance transporter
MHRTLGLIVLILANFMDLMDTTVVNVALPTIRLDLGATAAQLEWVVSAYTLGLATTLILGGRAGDLVGRRTVFVVGVLGFTAASALSACAPDGTVLVAARALQGAFAGLMVPQVLASVQDMYAPEKRGPIFGLVGFVTGSAAVVGPVLAGWLIAIDAFGIGWRSIFAINVPVGAAIAIASFFVVPNGRASRKGRLDILGAVFSTTAVVALMLPLVEGRQLGWPAWSWVSFAASAVLIVALILWERRVDALRPGDAFIPLHLFRNAGYRGGAIANFTYQAGLASFFLFLALYLQVSLGYSALQAGLTWLGFSIGTLVGSVVASTPLATRFRTGVMGTGASATAAALLWIAVLAIDSQRSSALSGWSLTPPLGLAGIGLGALIVPLFSATLERVTANDAGGASGALSMLQQVGGSLGVATVGAAFFAVAGNNPTASSTAEAFPLAAILAAALFACAAVATLLLRRPRPRSAALTASVPTQDALQDRGR